MADKVIVGVDDLTALADAARTRLGTTQTYSLEELTEVVGSATSLPAGGKEGLFVSSDNNGNPIWSVPPQADWNINDTSNPSYIQNRTHWKETEIKEVLNWDNVVAAEIGDDNGDGVNDTAIFTTAWTEDLVANNTYTITYNGIDYDCLATIPPAEMELPEGLLLLGNLTKMGLEGLIGNVDAPFYMLAVSNNLMTSTGGMSAAILFTDGAAPIAVSIGGMAENTIVHKLDKDYISGIEQIVINVNYTNEGYTYTTDASFLSAWNMTTAELMAAITFNFIGGNIYTDFEISVLSISRHDFPEYGYQGFRLGINIVPIDWDDLAYAVNYVEYVSWNLDGINPERTVQFLPYLRNNNNTEWTNGVYLKGFKPGYWRPITPSELISDLKTFGLSGDFVVEASALTSQTTTPYTLSNLTKNKTYSEIATAYNAGQSIRLRLLVKTLNADLFKEEIPLGMYNSSDGIFTFWAHDKGQLSGQTFTIDLNDTNWINQT